MVKSSKSPSPAQVGIGHNSKSPLSGYVEDWHRLDRNDLVARGELLLKAHNTGEYKDWEVVCAVEFGISHDTARNLMQVAEVAERHENFRELRVRKSTLYALAGIDNPEFPSLKPDEPDNKNLPTIIEALVEAGKAAGKTLSIKAADDTIYFAPLRKKYGADLPDATLVALKESVDNETSDWGRAAAKQLKKDKPEEDEDANAIVAAHHRAHVAEIYKVPVAALPEYLIDELMLDDMEKVPAKLRKKVLAKLQSAESDVTYDYISDVITEIEKEREAADEEQSKGEQEADDKQNAADEEQASRKPASPSRRPARGCSSDGKPRQRQRHRPRLQAPSQRGRKF